MKCSSAQELVSFAKSTNNICVLAGSDINLTNFTVTFEGANNRLYIEDGVCLQGCTVLFKGSGSVVYLSKSRHPYRISVSIFNKSSLFIDRENYFNGVLNLVISEHKSIVIGKNCLFSFGIWMRTADPHLIYDQNTCQRVNDAKSIVVGDHVWLGQDCMLLKGARIGSGSVVATRAVVSSAIESDAVCGGVPARVIKREIFWGDSCTHTWDEERTETQSIAPKSLSYSDSKCLSESCDIAKELTLLKTPDEVLMRFKQLATDETTGRFSVLPR